jgi:hypothetical protein
VETVKYLVYIQCAVLGSAVRCRWKLHWTTVRESALCREEQYKIQA